MIIHPLRAVCRELGKALLPRRRLPFLGTHSQVVFEARHAWPERDYEVLRCLAKDASCVLDIGANKGITGLIILEAMRPDGILVAFEPSSESCRILGANLAANRVSERVIIVEAFVSQRSGRVVRFDTASASVHNAEKPESGSGEETGRLFKPTLAIDDFLAERPMAPDFVKIDVEGAEQQVLEGMNHCLKFQRPLVFVEVHELPSLSVSEHAVLVSDRMKPLGYRVISTATGCDLRADELADAKTRTHLLLVPEDRSIPVFPKIPLA